MWSVERGRCHCFVYDEEGKPERCPEPLSGCDGATLPTRAPGKPSTPAIGTSPSSRSDHAAAVPTVARPVGNLPKSFLIDRRATLERTLATVIED